ncbi:MAG: GGDEF domain-containing protein [Candidatus Marsarchaeota archaeon]|nr:GGDEF domain-containing protein [Candidatus Marsarchaeota archaeon]MCL5106456.1 GGDEF domain-containing protein [Candidatus Marsarchaeota archaeon]
MDNESHGMHKGKKEGHEKYNYYLLNSKIIILKKRVSECKKEIMSLKAKNKKLDKLAMIDPLTKIGNRNLLRFEMRKQFENAMRENSDFGLLLIDIDNLKVINDVKGHNEGDRIIKNTAGVIKKNTRNIDTVCRIGGDEFVVITANSGLDKVGTIELKLKEAFKKEGIDVSMGFSSLKENRENVSDKENVKNSAQMQRLFRKYYFKLYVNADKRMYSEKKSKRVFGAST